MINFRGIFGGSLFTVILFGDKVPYIDTKNHMRLPGNRNFLCLAIFAGLFFVTASAGLGNGGTPDVKKRDVTITRDTWGIAHVHGKTDADAVFGGIYAQAEDDLNRIEMNYLTALGRLAEAEGEKAIWQDLRQRMFIDPDKLQQDYAASPKWLKDLMDAWADGLNFYLAAHPEAKTRVIKHFEPWMALSFTEGSIGGDIESIDLSALRAFYEKDSSAVSIARPFDPFAEPTGSNGIAIAPSNTKNGNSLLLINPHTSFFFRSELQMTSDEGLNAYGAATWGQFFIYQGFNEHCGWMHTSSAVDAIDEFAETVTKKGDGFFYLHGGKEYEVSSSRVRLRFRSNGKMEERTFTIYRTPHGPVVQKRPDGKWITVSLMNKPIEALTQSFTRTKARGLSEFKQVMELHANSSNNTIFADDRGHIAYFHANYIPRRNDSFDWTKPVDGSDPATDYKGLLDIDGSPNMIDPATGWVYNSNDWPWAAAGSASIKQSDYPKYVDSGRESARGRHAVMLLQGRKGFTLESLNAAAYDNYLPWFEKPLPALIKAWNDLPAGELKERLSGPVSLLMKWDMRWGIDSVETSVAVFWATELMRATRGNIDSAQGTQMLTALDNATRKLTADFGTWETRWGEINRSQRITDDIEHPFTDAGPSIPVGFTSGNLGSLASFGARPYKGSKKWYGVSGNSFVAVVEFGQKVRAVAVTAGGESGDPRSPHFNDQAERYSTGALRPVYFYPSDLKDHIERSYRPGN